MDFYSIYENGKVVGLAITKVTKKTSPLAS